MELFLYRPLVRTSCYVIFTSLIIICTCIWHSIVTGLRVAIISCPFISLLRRYWLEVGRGCKPCDRSVLTPHPRLVVYQWQTFWVLMCRKMSLFHSYFWMMVLGSRSFPLRTFSVLLDPSKVIFRCLLEVTAVMRSLVLVSLRLGLTGNLPLPLVLSWCSHYTWCDEVFCEVSETQVNLSCEFTNFSLLCGFAEKPVMLHIQSPLFT